MKKIFFSILTITAISFAACSNNDSKTETKKHDMSNMNKDTTQHAVAIDDKEVKVVAVTYTNVDAKAAVSLKEIVDHYLHISNALANDNGSEAANAAKAMESSFGKLDKSLLTAEQKKLYDDIEKELKDHAGHIAKNGDKIAYQRDHFAMLSTDVYNLARAFGAGRTIYHDHCPMYNEKDGGAMWLSEVKEVKNPYFGSQMLTCGTIEEEIK